MPSPSASRSTDRESPSVQSVARRYHRAERAVSWLTALAAAGAFLAAFAAFSPLPALGVAVALVVALRVPVFRRRGTVRLRSEAAPEAVVDEFASATPPVLAFQWAVADEVVRVGDGNEDGGGDGSDPESGSDATYEFSYLLGLRSVSLGLDVDVTRPSDSPADGTGADGAVPPDAVAVVDIDATADGRPWGAYGVTVRDAEAGSEAPSDESGTIVDVELRPTRRFDLRRLPQGLVAGRYYADVLAAQGYEVLDRTVSLSR
ncbi:hypothetical protein C471_01840 [Halorubrum saccharovorum DSM 1137]|uniref:Uncharacterized protein n=1 Tax=Halorubrum saccharovorum DSM 1137 TaxID=1227484 RepID=M0E8J1_9EURY|nr:hypothetical protein [Halorubrum saccharovorum]ELZ42694.1 hypothetical protein C471_01840 [Halorubrum saccharovorum DSM 1137]